MTPLSNRAKAVIVDALKRKYSLPTLPNKLKMAKSSYYYQEKRASFTSRHETDLQTIAAIFQENKQRYGYRRIKVILNRQGYIFSEKVIRINHARKRTHCEVQKINEILLV